MSLSPVGPFRIETEAQANEYLAEILRRPEFRSIDEITSRANEYISDERLKAYFIDKGRQLLAAKPD